MKAPKQIRMPKLPRVRVRDVAWTVAVWAPYHAVRIVGLGLGLALVGAGVAAGKGGRVAWRHSRPHLARAGRWGAGKSRTAFTRVETRAAARWKTRTPPAELDKAAAKARRTVAPVRQRLAPVSDRLPKVRLPRRANTEKPAPAKPAAANAAAAHAGSRAASAGAGHRRVRATSARTHHTPAAAATAAADAGAAGAGGQSSAAQVAGTTTNTTSSRGAMRMQEFQNLQRQARVVGQLDPKTAWELDEQLAQFAAMWPKFAEAFSIYAENLDRQVKVDPRLVAAFVQSIGAMNELYKHFGATRRLYRQLYAQMLERQGVRMPDRKGFWDQQKAA